MNLGAFYKQLCIEIDTERDIINIINGSAMIVIDKPTSKQMRSVVEYFYNYRVYKYSYRSVNYWKDGKRFIYRIYITK